MRILGRAIASVAPALLAGAFYVSGIAMLFEKTGPREFVGGFVFGAVYGLAVLGLLRLFAVARWAFPVAGILVGPIPAALITSAGRGMNTEDRAGFWLLTTILGLLVGLLEWARLSRRDALRAGD